VPQTLKRVLNALAVAAALVVTALVARHFAREGWPIRHANPWLVALAALSFVTAYAVKAWGWQRLFRREEQPAMLTLAASAGAASVGGIALPGRCDEVIRFAVIRRCRRRRASFGAVALSIFLLGLIDSAALTPLAGVAAGVGAVDGLFRLALAIVAGVGVAAAGVVLALPRIARIPRVARFRFATWVHEHATSPRDAAAAWAAVATSWTLRAIAIFVLLAALDLGSSFALALAFLCASSASAVLPVAPAGAATQAGAGAATLIAAGVHAEQAVAFGVAAQALVIAAGAVFVAAMAAWHAHGKLVLARRAVAARA
jgi:uncharacterized membrane protein YbhN (UPF0104 family)